MLCNGNACESIIAECNQPYQNGFEQSFSSNLESFQMLPAEVEKLNVLTNLVRRKYFAHPWSKRKYLVEICYIHLMLAQQITIHTFEIPHLPSQYYC